MSSLMEHESPGPLTGPSRRGLFRVAGLLGLGSLLPTMKAAEVLPTAATLLHNGEARIALGGGGGTARGICRVTPASR